MRIWKTPKTASADTTKLSNNDSRATTVDLPGLINLRYQSSHISLASQRKAYSALAGNFNSPFKGRGLNFDEVRPYQAGDDIRNIDWNVTARTDKVHTKVFKEERERPVFIIIDLSSSMYFGTRRCLKSVTAAKAAALFAWASADNSNRIGGLIYNDSQHIQMRPKGGHRGVLQFLKMLSDFHNNSLTATQTPIKTPPLNTEQLFFRMQKFIHPGSIVLFASDFNQTQKAQMKHLAHIARHNDVLITHIYDALETQLPAPGQYSVSNGEDSQLLDTRNARLCQSFQELFQNKQHYIERFCLQNQIHLVNLATHQAVAQQFIAVLGQDASLRRTARSRH